jgi:sucrose phosphorylase
VQDPRDLSRPLRHSEQAGDLLAFHYAHSLFGSHNDTVGMAETGRARTINRQKWLKVEVEAVLANPASHSYQVFERYRQLLQARREQAAFHPNGAQQVVGGNPALFSLLRISPDGRERVLCLHNITARPQPVAIDELPLRGSVRNLLSGETVNLGDGSPIELPPYGVLWLT